MIQVINREYVNPLQVVNLERKKNPEKKAATEKGDPNGTSRKKAHDEKTMTLDSPGKNGRTMGIREKVIGHQSILKRQARTCTRSLREWEEGWREGGAQYKGASKGRRLKEP